MDQDWLLDLDTKINYSPINVNINTEHRLEGMNNPSDMSILYVLETGTGGKGTVLVKFCPSSNLETSEFFKQIPEENFLRENSNLS